MPDLHVAVIIPSSLKAPQRFLLRKALHSLDVAAHLANEVKLTICVVSEREVPNSFRADFDAVSFIHAARGVGFAGLNNQGLEFLQEKFRKGKAPDWLLLLNDDALLADDFFIRLGELEKSAQHSVDIYAPLILDARNHQVVDSFGIEYFSSGYGKNNMSSKVKSTLATAGCQLIRWSFAKKYTDTYGFFFNPLYYYYFEDVDFSLRAVMIGARIKREASLIAFHYGSSTSGGKQNTFALRMTYRNLIWVIVCCWPRHDIQENLFSMLLLQCWTCLYITMRCGILAYSRIWWETLGSLKSLNEYRAKILPHYKKSSLRPYLSPFTFRTYHDKTIPALPFRL